MVNPVAQEPAAFIDTTSDDIIEVDALAPQGVTEKDAQEYIISYLVGVNGFERGASADLNPVSGLDEGRLVAFVRDTQPDVWEYFCQWTEPDKELLVLVQREKESRGTLAVLRDGIPSEGARPEIVLMFSGSALNPEQQARWGQNMFVVYDEVKYETCANPTRRIDLVIGINGIPLQAVELKNELTGQSRAHAEEQFRLTRSNREPLLRPVTGCVTYFSMSRREVAVATVLKGPTTKFLPFNQGRANGGKGNPPVDDHPEYHGFRTHYMLHEIWTKECLTDIVFKFMYVENDRNLSGLTVDELEQVPVVFPRYHQIRLVRRLVSELASGGHEKAFLIQHSAGSGKTLSIAWLAHQVVRMVGDDGDAAYDHVIIVTDRVAIVNHLDRAVRLLNRHDGLIAEVKNSRGLGDAIKVNKRMIVTSIQKFGRLNKLVDTIEKADGKRFLVVIDEAHSGQAGENAAGVVELLGASIADELAEMDERAPNIVFAAFTATPKAVTLAKFGRDNKAYDLYSMRQAIEEGQILNVLKNYVTVQTLNRLWNDGDDRELPDSVYAKRAMNSYVRTHEVNLEHKAGIILDSMVTNTLLNIGGLGRGMVVVSGRMDVHKYVTELRRQIAANPELYGHVRPAGAYTGTLDIDGTKIDDSALNGFNTDEVPHRLSLEDAANPDMINLLVVADKYQTGFDEPLLCSMYVDKTLHGITAVQTLNRLNRIRRQGDKENVLVVDFQDNEDEVRKAFAEYGVEARIKTMATVNNLEASALALYAYGIFTSEQVDAYHTARQNMKTDPVATTTMSNILNRVLDNIEDYTDTADRELLETFENFRYEIRNFLEDFVFVSQFQKVHDDNLKGLYVFLKLLSQLIKAPRRGLGDTEWLESIRVEIVHSETLSKNLSALQDLPEPVGETGGKPGASHKSPHDARSPITIEQLIEEYNEKLKTMILGSAGVESADDGSYSKEILDGYDLAVFHTVVERAVSDTRLEEYARNRSSQRFESDNTRDIIHKIILSALVEDKIANKGNDAYINLPYLYSNNPEFAERLRHFALSAAYQTFLRRRLEGVKKREGETSGASR